MKEERSQKWLGRRYFYLLDKAVVHMISICTPLSQGCPYYQEDWRRTHHVSKKKRLLIQPVHSKGDQSWMFFGRTDVEAEIPILWPPDVKSWLIWIAPDAEKDWEGGDWKIERGEGDDRWWDGWMASPTQWTWVWVDSSSWWWTGRPGMLRQEGPWRPWGHKELGSTEQLNWICSNFIGTTLCLQTKFCPLNSILIT